MPRNWLFICGRKSAYHHSGDDESVVSHHHFCSGASRYMSCIILSVSHLAQTAISVFAHGRAGQQAAEILDMGAQLAAIAVHNEVDVENDNNFYDLRGQSEEVQRYPQIEGWARYISESSNAFINYVNIATQLGATGRLAISMHDLILGAQFCMTFFSTIGVVHLDQGTIQAMNGLAVTSAAHKIANIHVPTIVIAGVSNSFFDWLSDTVIRDTIIYPVVDTLEDILDGFSTDYNNKEQNEDVEVCFDFLDYGLFGGNQN